MSFSVGGETVQTLNECRALFQASSFAHKLSHRPPPRYSAEGLPVPFSKRPIQLVDRGGVFNGLPLYGYRLIENSILQFKKAGFGDGADRRVLVVGSGTGYEAIVLAKRFPKLKILASDIFRPAVEATLINAENHGVAKQIHAIESDLLDSVDGQFDAILFNAPRPVLRGEVATESRWADFKSKPGFFDPEALLLKRFLAQIPAHLKPKGMVLLMTDLNMKVAVGESMKSFPLSSDSWVGDPNETFFDQFAIQKIEFAN